MTREQAEAVRRDAAAAESWAEIDRRTCAIAAEHKHMIDLLVEIFADIAATTEGRLKDSQLRLTEKMLDTLEAIRAATGGEPAGPQAGRHEGRYYSGA